MLKLIKFKQQNDSGQAMVEFALTIGIFLMIIFFIIDFGWIAFHRTSFEYGYMHAGWSISADDLGDKDPLEEVSPSTEAPYSGETVSDILREDVNDRSFGIIDSKLEIKNANAKLYNKDKTYKVPGRVKEESVDAISITRYMDLTADFTYEIHPLTPIGGMVFGNTVTIDKKLDCTRVVKTQNRSE